jgi:hypothetical protein
MFTPLLAVTEVTVPALGTAFTQLVPLYCRTLPDVSDVMDSDVPLSLSTVVAPKVPLASPVSVRPESDSVGPTPFTVEVSVLPASPIVCVIAAFTTEEGVTLTQLVPLYCSKLFVARVSDRYRFALYS